MSHTNEAEAGQAIYSKLVLSIYDWWVLAVSNKYIWQCPTERMVALYNAHITANHLDIGVGTGYYLDHCRFPTDQPRLVLIDLNENSLETTARRVARYRPETRRQNVLEPFKPEPARFDSVGLNYLLHCLPGDIAAKAVVFDHAKSVLNQGGVLFGATLLQTGVERSGMAKRLMKVYNRKQIFSNRADSLAALQESLAGRFAKFELEVIGCAALFWGQVDGR